MQAHVRRRRGQRPDNVEAAAIALCCSQLEVIERLHRGELTTYTHIDTLGIERTYIEL